MSEERVSILISKDGLERLMKIRDFLVWTHFHGGQIEDDWVGQLNMMLMQAEAEANKRKT